MAYDETLAEQIRELLAGDPAITEKRMFGGLAFMHRGHMAVCAASEGGMLVRIDPDGDDHTADEHVNPMVMRGRPLTGWVLVAREGLTDGRVAGWVERGVAYARTLPPK